MKMTVDELFSEIEMIRTKYQGPIFLVEGDTDSRLFEKLFTDEKLKIIPTFGWENVIGVLKKIAESKITFVLGIIDQGYLKILSLIPKIENLFATDCHDLEIMMVESDCFSYVINEICSMEKVKKERGGINSVRDVCYNISCNIGAVRFYSLKKNLGYKFEEIDFSKFVDRKNLYFSVGKFLNHIRNKWPENNKINEEVYEVAGKCISNIPELKARQLLCCGHDFMEILSRGLQYKWGTYSANQTSAKSIEKMFRLAYSKENFSKTELMKNIYQWLKENVS